MSACTECGKAQCTEHRRHAAPAPETPPCTECGAHVGHRLSKNRACSLSGSYEDLSLLEEARRDALGYARLLSEVWLQRDAYFTQLSEVQARCTALLEEVRALKAREDVNLAAANQILRRDLEEWKKSAIMWKTAHHFSNPCPKCAADDAPPSAPYCGAV